MQTETSHEPYAELDTWPLARSLAALVESNIKAAQAVQRARPELERAAQGIEEALRNGGRLIYIGAGTSGRLALQDAAELPPTFGFTRTAVLLAGGAEAADRAQEGAEDDEDAAKAEVDALHLSQNDAVIGIAASGATPYTVAGVTRSRERGAFTVGLANNADAPLLSAAHVGVPLATGPEVLAGSTRLGAGTAQKIALNALSTSVLVRLGGAYGNLMVGMRPVNDKLRRRSVRIVKEAAGADEKHALQVLERAEWDLRAAIVMLKAAVGLEEAQQRLAACDSNVRRALET